MPSASSPDTEVYHLAPYGRGNGQGIGVGYSVFEPPAASPMYAPVPSQFGGQPGSPPPGASRNPWSNGGAYPPQGRGPQPTAPSSGRMPNPTNHGAPPLPLPLPTGTGPSAANASRHGMQAAKSSRWSLKLPSLWPKATQKIRQAGYDKPNAGRQIGSPPRNFRSSGTAPRRTYR
jgi:hypothetical protein